MRATRLKREACLEAGRATTESDGAIAWLSLAPVEKHWTVALDVLRLPLVLRRSAGYACARESLRSSTSTTSVPK